MLRVSSQVNGDQVNLQSLVSGASVSSGVPGDTVLLEFAEAVFAGDPASIAGSREAVSGELGESAMIDAAAVIANFHRMVRIADATGIPLDGPLALITEDLRDEIGVSRFTSAENTPSAGMPRRLFGRLVARIVPRLFRAIQSLRRLASRDTRA